MGLTLLFFEDWNFFVLLAFCTVSTAIIPTSPFVEKHTAHARKGSPRTCLVRGIIIEYSARGARLLGRIKAKCGAIIFIYESYTKAAKTNNLFSIVHITIF